MSIIGTVPGTLQQIRYRYRTYDVPTDRPDDLLHPIKPFIVSAIGSGKKAMRYQSPLPHLLSDVIPNSSDPPDGALGRNASGVARRTAAGNKSSDDEAPVV